MFTARYAIYFAPVPFSPWWELGTSWLGRDERNDATREQPRCKGIDADRLRALTAAPRRYGFHATLKAPFRLRPGVTESTLFDRVRWLATSLSPVTLTPMTVARLDTFVALVAEITPPGVARIESACVTELDELCAPLTEVELAARRAVGLDARAEELLLRHGYTHVLDRFRLHFTLTGPIDSNDAERVSNSLRDVLHHLNHTAPLTLDRLCVFVETDTMRNLRRITDFEIGARA